MRKCFQILIDDEFYAQANSPELAAYMVDVACSLFADDDLDVDIVEVDEAETPDEALYLMEKAEEDFLESYLDEVEEVPDQTVVWDRDSGQLEQLTLNRQKKMDDALSALGLKDD